MNTDAFKEEAFKIINNIESETEIIVVCQQGELGYKNYIVAFDIQSRDSRIIGKGVSDITVGMLYQHAPIITGVVGDKSTINLPSIKYFGKPMPEVLCTVDLSFGNSCLKNAYLKEAYVGYCAAEFTRICSMMDVSPEEFTARANNEYWNNRHKHKMSYEKFPIESTVWSSGVTRLYFEEAIAALNMRPKIFREDLLDKFHNGSRFCLKEVLSSPGSYSISEHIAADNSIDLYKVDKETFDMAKGVLPKYGYISIEDYSKVHVYVGIKGVEPILISDIDAAAPTQKTEKACIGTAELFYEVGVVNDTIKDALSEYFNSMETGPTSLINKRILRVPIASTGGKQDISFSIAGALSTQKANRLACEADGERVDISKNCFYLESKRIEENDLYY